MPDLFSLSTFLASSIYAMEWMVIGIGTSLIMGSIALISNAISNKRTHWFTLFLFGLNLVSAYFLYDFIDYDPVRWFWKVPGSIGILGTLQVIWKYKRRSKSKKKAVFSPSEME